MPEQELLYLREARRSTECTAIPVYLGIRALLAYSVDLDEDDDVDEWEPEAVRLEVQERDAKVPDENVDIYLAVRTMRTTPSFCVDAMIFEKTVMALNREPIVPDQIQLAIPPYIAWAVMQAKLLIPGEWDLAYEPVGYAVASCIQYGLVVCPETLEFACELLEQQTAHREELRRKVQARWNSMSQEQRFNAPYAEDNPVDVQLALLASTEEYVTSQRKQLERELSRDLPLTQTGKPAPLAQPAGG